MKHSFDERNFSNEDKIEPWTAIIWKESAVNLEMNFPLRLHPNSSVTRFFSFFVDEIKRKTKPSLQQLFNVDEFSFL